MEKQYYTVVKLAPHVSSWCDIENNIYLSIPNKTFKRLKEGCDMKMINKGVKAGLIILEVRCEEDEPNTPGKPVEPDHDVLPENPLDPPSNNDCDCIPEVENAVPIFCLRSKETAAVEVKVNIVEDEENDKEEE